MNSFDERWKRLAGQARSTEDIPDAAPFGFATRVLARCQPASSICGDRIWEQLGLRAAGLVSLALLIFVTVEFTGAPKSSSLTPHVEETVSQVFWIL